MAVARALVGRGYVQLAGGDRRRGRRGAARAGWTTAERLQLGYLVVEAEAALARWSCAAATSKRRGRRRHVCSVALGQPDLLGAIQPGEIYRSCWQVLAEFGDPRAEASRRGSPSLPRQSRPPGSTTRTCASRSCAVCRPTSSLPASPTGYVVTAARRPSPGTGRPRRPSVAWSSGTTLCIVSSRGLGAFDRPSSTASRRRSRR